MISPWAKLLLFNNATFFDQEMVKPHRSSQPGSLFDLNPKAETLNARYYKNLSAKISVKSQQRFSQWWVFLKERRLKYPVLKRSQWLIVAPFNSSVLLVNVVVHAETHKYWGKSSTSKERLVEFFHLSSSPIQVINSREFMAGKLFGY